MAETRRNEVNRIRKELDWNISQVAEFMGVPERTMYRWLKQGEGVGERTAFRIECGLEALRIAQERITA